jgi:uncharacterized protein (UPF0335 family)
MHSVSAQLKSIIDRVETLEEQKADIVGDIKLVYTEAASNGFDKVVLRRLVALRKMKPHERQEFQALMDSYIEALGGL